MKKTGLSFYSIHHFSLLPCTKNKRQHINKTITGKESPPAIGQYKSMRLAGIYSLYSKILVSTTDGKCFDVPPSSVINPPAGMAGKAEALVNSNYLFSITKKYSMGKP